MKKEFCSLLMVLSAGYFSYRSLVSTDDDFKNAPPTKFTPTASTVGLRVPAVSVTPPSGQDCDITNVNELIEPNPEFHRNIEKELDAAVAAGGYRRMAETTTLAERMAAYVLATKCSKVGANADLSFVSIDSLMQITSQLCAAIPERDVAAPLTLIQDERMDGAPEAMLAAAKGALTQAKYLEYTDADPNQVHYYLSLSEQFGRRAAAIGFAPAMAFMAEQYDVGGFGQVELTKAYVYAKQIVWASQGESGRAGIDYLYSKMTRSQYDLAEDKVKRCNPLAMAR